jgi:hypothetical protein
MAAEQKHELGASSTGIGSKLLPAEQTPWLARACTMGMEIEAIAVALEPWMQVFSKMGHSACEIRPTRHLG